MTAYVEVNECRVWVTERGRQWWDLYRIKHSGRITTLTASIAGDRVQVACDSKEDADWLAGHMVEQGIPASAVAARELQAKKTGVRT